MGGRGSGSGMKRTSVFSSTKERVIEGYYRRARGLSSAYYSDVVYEAVDNKNGDISFVRSKPEFGEPTAKTNRTVPVAWHLKAGIYNNEVFGINWDNVKSVSGNTYDIRSEIKKHGFTWDSKNKRWIKKK